MRLRRIGEIPVMRSVSTMVKRKRLGSVLGVCSGLGFLASAALHTPGFLTVFEHTGKGPEGLLPLVQLLWVSFSASLVVMGLSQ
jgi:hypothetical protein